MISPDGRVWEVKRDRLPQIAKGYLQVKKYTQNKWHKNENIKLEVGDYIPSGQFVHQGLFATYYVTYRYVGNSVIAYDYYEVTDWHAVGEMMIGLVVIAGVTFIISISGGSASPVLLLI